MKIVCYMYASLDGRIDCAMTEKIDPEARNYYNHLASFGDFTQINGKVTNALHYAEPGVFKSSKYVPAGKTFFKAQEAKGYQVCMDTSGTLLWSQNAVAGKPLIVVTGEKVSTEYLEYLKSKNISYIACGKDKIDLKKSIKILESEFNVKLCVVTGGGHINASFLDAGLLDEIQMMFGAGIDGRKGFAASFDGREESKEPVLLELENVETLEKGTVLLKYRVKKQEV